MTPPPTTTTRAWAGMPARVELAAVTGGGGSGENAILASSYGWRSWFLMAAPVGFPVGIERQEHPRKRTGAAGRKLGPVQERSSARGRNACKKPIWCGVLHHAVPSITQSSVTSCFISRTARQWDD